MPMNDLSRSFKLVTVWLLLGVATFLGVQAWLHQRDRTAFVVDGSSIEIERGADGHYRWPGRVNGREVEFLIDTGATGTAIPASLARELDLPQRGVVRSHTAGGPVDGVVVLADISLRGGVRADRLRVVALPGLARPLLGMDVLSRLDLVQRGGVLRVERGRGDAH